MHKPKKLSSRCNYSCRLAVAAMTPLLIHLVVFLSVLASASVAAASAGAVCESPVFCGEHVEIKYPFFLSNSTADVDVVTDKNTSGASHCGYPWLGIICDVYDGDRRAILRLGRDNYTVLEINHGNHTVTVADTDALDAATTCPRVKHNATLPPVLRFPIPNNDSIAFFFDCNFTGNFAQPADITPINCGGFGLIPGALPSFLVPQADTPEGEWWKACKEVYVAPVMRTWLASPLYYPQLGGDGYGQVLKRGFQLTWDPTAGECHRCEISGGQCSYDNNTTFLGCLCSDGHVSTTDCGPKISRKRAIVIATSTAACVLFLLLVVVCFLYIRKRRQYKMSSSSRLLKYTTSGGTPRSNNGSSSHSTMESGSFHYLQTHHFSYEELEEATDGFSDARELGDGGFGTVYKGELRDGRVVAVKRLYNNSCKRVEQFVNEAAILSRLRHPNLVLFYGCTSSRSRELVLVYEFVPNGTVADHLHGNRAAERVLTWPLRLDIAVEAAAALAYLHAVEPPIVHRDIKTNNILLDANFHVKVADFGLSRLFPRDATHVSTAPQGTPGYVDPEYHQCYQLTDKSDVYSFGVVLAELISSKPAVDVTRDRDEINLAGMAINKIQRCQVDQLVDHELGYGSDQATRKMMTMVAELAFRCLQHNGEMRPPIKEVFDVLRGIQEECRAEKKGSKRDSPCSPNTVHASWDSRSTTPNTSQ